MDEDDDGDDNDEELEEGGEGSSSLIGAFSLEKNLLKGPVNIYGNTGPGNPQPDHGLFSYFFRVSRIYFSLLSP